MKQGLNHDGWHFPLIEPTKPQQEPKFDIEHYLNHIVEEVKEFEEETDPVAKRKEAVDILHSAETFIRHYFERTEGLSFEEIKEMVISKNKQRGYYD